MLLAIGMIGTSETMNLGIRSFPQFKFIYKLLSQSVANLEAVMHCAK